MLGIKEEREDGLWVSPACWALYGAPLEWKPTLEKAAQTLAKAKPNTK